MDTRLNIILLILVIFLGMGVLKSLIRNRLNLKYSVIWFVFILVLFIIAIVPNFVYWLSDVIGINVPSNCVFLIAICFLIAMVFSLSIRISFINRRTVDLAQQVGLLEKRIQEKTDIYNNYRVSEEVRKHDT